MRKKKKRHVQPQRGLAAMEGPSHGPFKPRARFPLARSRVVAFRAPSDLDGPEADKPCTVLGGNRCPGETGCRSGCRVHNPPPGTGTRSPFGLCQRRQFYTLFLWQIQRLRRTTRHLCSLAKCSALHICTRAHEESPSAACQAASPGAPCKRGCLICLFPV